MPESYRERISFKGDNVLIDGETTSFFVKQGTTTGPDNVKGRYYYGHRIRSDDGFDYDLFSNGRGFKDRMDAALAAIAPKEIAEDRARELQMHLNSEEPDF